MSTLVSEPVRIGTRERVPAVEVTVADPVRCRRRRTLRFFAFGAAGMVPWTIVMALTLPAEHQVHEWRTAWAGFDALLVLSLAATAFLGWRRNPAGILTALLTAVLLICDAWFDVSLDLGTRDIWLSAAMALFVELPVAAILIRRAYSLISALQWPPRTAADPDGSPEA